MRRRLAIGDIHGRFEALAQVFERSKFDFKEDELMILGDVSDGGYNTNQVVEVLLKIKHKVFILGNHDEWLYQHFKDGFHDEIWIQQGGANTLRSYGCNIVEAEQIVDDSTVLCKGVKYPRSHVDFFEKAVLYHIHENMVFVHGGFNPMLPLDKQRKDTFLWDRCLIDTAKKKPIYYNGPGTFKSGKINKKVLWDKVFVGHTTTQCIDNDLSTTHPLQYNNLYALDCGAGWNGRLAIMDIYTDEYWLSDYQKPALLNINFKEGDGFE